ncbi:glycosyltransferase family 2 protein [Massilibacteroides vaginae]|uniref:glycosyltransferase family 2 protein n=1 Tax=Massilibacteroides vaginae TaxID=1673718 RepID=UPI000A1C81B0|nr:glycosyltransferase family 2 protein [Massilibacteroides vaginae]
MKVSIITVCYNAEKTLKDTIESVLLQTYANIEYIIVDGASNDNSLVIVKECESLFEGRLKWISEPDKGIYDAMNKGIRLASGEIVGILNSDDFFANEDCIAKIVETFKDKDIQAVYGDVRFVSPKDLSKTVRYYSSQIFSPKLFRFGFMPAHPSFYTYRKYFEEFGFYRIDYKIAADYELLIRFLYKQKLKTKYLQFDIVTMRTGGESTRSWRSNLILNQEIVRACKYNDIYTNLPLLMLKYLYKITELFGNK